MARNIIIQSESWPLERPFRISRGVKTAADVVVVEINDGIHTGRGECVPYPRYGESVDSVAEQIRSVLPALEQGASRIDCRRLLSAGAALNAIDSALWDLEARASGQAVDQILNLARPAKLITALTVGLDTPEQMGLVAAQMSAAPVIKVKVDGQSPDRQLQAVHDAAPNAKLIVDANEGWSIEILSELNSFLKKIGAVLIEQPLQALFLVVHQQRVEKSTDLEAARANCQSRDLGIIALCRQRCLLTNRLRAEKSVFLHLG